MAKIHDWKRAFWRNASGDRQFWFGTPLDELDDEAAGEVDAEVDDNTRCTYHNTHGDVVSYGVAEMVEVEVESDDEDEESVTEQVYENGHKYEVRFNGDLISGEQVAEACEAGDVLPEDTEVPDVAAFDTRAQAREFSAAWRSEFGSPEALGHVEPTPEVEAPDVESFEIGDMTSEELVALDDYSLLKEMADRFDIKQNQSGQALAEQLSGESEPELTADAEEVEAE